MAKLLQFILLVTCLSLTATSFAQEKKQISGRVTDKDGAPLIGVTVFVKGSNNGATTNLSGVYNISVGNSKDVTLDFSYVGMKTEKRNVTLTSRSTVVNVRLDEDVNIETVIIQGYGRVQKREDLVGSAFQVEASDLEYKPMARLDNILDGMVPGLSIDPNTDSPGSPQTRYNIRIRGEASLSASNEPLWIIDGVPMYTGSGTNSIPGMSYSISPLSFISPEDIESITVLKDASEVSIYGADGANGVIILTTKSGRMGAQKRDIRASIRYGVSSIDESTKFKVLNANQYMDYAKEAWVNGGNNINLFPYQDNDHNSYSTTDTNWYDQYYGIGQNLSANLSISESSNKSSSYFSLSYYEDSGTIKGNEQQRISARMNNTYKLGNKLTLRPILSASYNINDIFPASHEYYELLPIFSPFDNDGHTYRLSNRYVSGMDGGELTWEDDKFWDNTIAERELNDNTQKTFATDGNVSLEYNIIEGLSATTQFGVAYQHSYEKIYASRHTLGGMVDNQPSGQSRRSSANYLSWTNINRVNFNRTFGKHNVSALAGVELSSKGYNSVYATGEGFVNDQTQEVGDSQEASRRGSSSTSTTRKLSFFGQVGYGYDSRYRVQFNVRREGNSSFGPYSRWENYFSVGGTWNVHREGFFESEVIDLLKFKASFGTSGNSRVDGAMMRGLGMFSYGDSNSYNGIMGGVVSTPANPGISWEKTYMGNIGVDVRLWDRLSIGLEGYYNYTTNLLSKIYTSRVIGDARIFANIGEISNLGVELTINSTNIRTDNFRWSTDLNISHNKNRIEKLFDNKSISYGSTISSVGNDVNTFYLVKWAGVDPSTGAPMWYDKDGNLTYSYSDSDRVADKSSTPTVFGGMTNTFRYKGFSFSFLLNYSIGGHALSSLASRGTTDGYGIIDQNTSINSLDYWQKPGDISANPRISTVTSSSGRFSTKFLYNKTNIRLQNLSLTYSLPISVCEKLHLEQCRVSFIGDNLYLFTLDQDSGQNSYKTMMYGYPVERTFSLSLDLSF